MSNTMTKNSRTMSTMLASSASRNVSVVAMKTTTAMTILAMILVMVVAFIPTSTMAQESECYDNLSSLNAVESAITDTSEPRSYVLCPETTFVTGILEAGVLVEGQAPLNLRPNVSIQCGESGSRTNNCVVTGGIGLLGTAANFGDASLGSVAITGVTFSELTSVTFFIRLLNGDITVTDCAFLVRT